MGAPGQAADAQVIADFPSLWTAAHRADGIAYLVCEFGYDETAFPSSLPMVTATLRGARCFDPRTGLTAFTENPAIQQRHVLTHPYFGKRSTLSADEDARIVAAANACDVGYNYGQGHVPMYRASIVLPFGGAARDGLDDLAQAMAGQWAYAAGEFFTRAGVYTAPVISLTEADLAVVRRGGDGGANQQSIGISTHRARAEKFNVITPRIFDIAQNYKQVPVMNFQHGAMENTTATIFGDFFCVDSFSFNDRNYVGVNAHELAHQWFGNLVTATQSTHHWLHEGFASYYAWLAEKEVFGPDRFALLRKESLERVLAAEERDMFPLAHGQAGSERFYDKGAWVLFMLRKSIGDKAWQAGIADYLNKNALGLATTETFRESMEYGCGCNLQRFFDQWVYRPQLPKLKLRIEESDDVVHILAEQDLMAGQPFYNLFVPLKLITSKGERNNTLVFDAEYASLSLSIAKNEKLVAVLPDMNFELPATWEIDAPLYLVENAASSNTSQWYFAAQTLPERPDYNPKFAERMVGASYLNRLAFAEGLGKRAAKGTDLGSEEVKFLQAEKEIAIVKAFLTQGPALRGPMLKLAESWLQWPSYDVVEIALIRLCINDKANAKRYLEKTKDIVGTSGHNVRITWLLLYSAFVSQDKTTELTEYMSAKYDFLTRIKAFEAAQQLNLVNYTVANHAFGSLLQGNRKLRSAGRDFIKAMSAQTKNKDVFQGWINRNQQILSPDELKTIEQLTGYKPNN